jgi:hypothetical protein
MSMSVISEAREGAVRSRTVRNYEHFDLDQDALEDLILESLDLPSNYSVSFAWASFGTPRVSIEISSDKED